jgi:hypothetical protein
MLNTVKKIVFAVGVVLCLVPISLSAAPPPTGVSEVIVEMGKFEENYQRGKWQEASESTERMEKEIKEIFVQAQLDDFVLEEALVDLKKQVALKNGEGVADTYIAFQKQYFNFVSHFDHDVHPILVKIEQYVMIEAPESFAKKDYEDVLREMQMAGMLVEHGKAVLINKGITEREINEFKSKLIILAMTGKKEDYAKMGELLEQLKTTYGSFMTRYKQK